MRNNVLVVMATAMALAACGSGSGGPTEPLGVAAAPTITAAQRGAEYSVPGTAGGTIPRGAFDFRCTHCTDAVPAGQAPPQTDVTFTVTGVITVPVDAGQSSKQVGPAGENSGFGGGQSVCSTCLSSSCPQYALLVRIGAEGEWQCIGYPVDGEYVLIGQGTGDGGEVTLAVNGNFAFQDQYTGAFTATEVADPDGAGQ